MDTIISLRPKQFAEQFRKHPQAILIDVRRDEELASGYIEGAIHINFEDHSFTEKVASLDPTKAYFVCCRAGNRSLKFCEYLQEKGFKNLVNLEAGIFSWVNYGYDLTQKAMSS